MAPGAIFLIWLCTFYVDKHVHKLLIRKIKNFCEFDKFLFAAIKKIIDHLDCLQIA